jgi:hypothetical protein
MRLAAIPFLLAALAPTEAVAQQAPSFCCLEGVSGLGEGDEFDAVFKRYDRDSAQVEVAVGDATVTGTAAGRAKLLLDESGLPPGGKLRLRRNGEKVELVLTALPP